MQGQRRQVVQRARRQVVGVEPVGAHATAAGGPERRDVRRHRHDGEARARQGHVLAQLTVGPLGDPCGARQQLFRRLRIELRISAQEGQELGEAALELHLLDDVVHFLLDACNFIQTDAVDLVRRQVQRGVFVDLLLVVRLAIGHRFGGQRGARLRHVLVDEEGAQLLERRHHLAADRFTRLRLQPGLLGGRNAVGQLLERRVQRRFGRVFQLGDGGDRHLAAIEHRARHAETSLQAGAHVFGLLAEVARHIIQAGDVVLVVLHGLHLAPGHEGQVGPERGVGVERHLVAAQTRFFGQVEHLVTVDRVVDLVVGRQGLRVDLLQCSQGFIPHLQARLLRGRADVGHAGGIGRSVLVLTGLAAALLAPLPFLLVQRAEGGIGGRFGGHAGRCGGGGRCGQGYGGGGQGDQQGNGKTGFHEHRFPGRQTPMMAPPTARGMGRRSCLRSRPGPR